MAVHIDVCFSPSAIPVISANIEPPVDIVRLYSSTRLAPQYYSQYSVGQSRSEYDEAMRRSSYIERHRDFDDPEPSRSEGNKLDIYRGYCGDFL